MGSVSIVLFIAGAFAAGNLLFQLVAVEFAQREERPKPIGRARQLEHPFHSRVDGMPRTRTDRRDLQLAMGEDFAAPDVHEHIWPRDPRFQG